MRGSRTLVMISVLAIGVATGWVAGWIGGAAPGYGQDEPEPAPAAETVRAQRYRLMTYDSALDYAHRAGREIVELHFPDAGIVCNTGTGFATDCAANAFYGPSRADLVTDEMRELLGDNAPPRVEPEEIEVPRVVFERARALADITRRRVEVAAVLKLALDEGDLLAIPE